MTRSFAIFPALILAACNAPAERSAAENEAANGAVEASANQAMPPFAEVEGAHPTAPEPAPIPSIFRGTWAEDNKACADRAHHSRLTISGRTVRHPDFVIFGDEVTASGNEFALKGKIEATGVPAEAHYSLNPEGNVLTDEAGGGAIRVRCA